MVRLTAAVRSAAKSFDYVIVGGGSAGCVMANRLSSDPRNSVLLVEAGPEDNSSLIQMPMGYCYLVPFSKKYNWQFETAPAENVGGRKLFWPRGKGLGGSSSINGMIYIRGNKWDYDNWAAHGCDGWDYESMLQCFRSTENHSEGANKYHGKNKYGIATSKYDGYEYKPIKAWQQAMMNSGYAWNDDFNGESQYGVGQYDCTVANGERCSAAKGFLTPIKDRPNLTIMTERLCAKVNVEGDRATGVELLKAGSSSQQTETIHAGEVILSAGAVQTPQILQLSGIGPRAELERHGIDVKHHLPGVGQNLQDHFQIFINAEVNTGDTICWHPSVLPTTLKGIYDYVSARKGLLSDWGPGAAFYSTDPSLPAPDIQIHFSPANYQDHGKKVAMQHGCAVSVCPMRPYSRGAIGLNSANPRDAPYIDSQYLSDQRDVAVLKKGMQMQLEVLRDPAIASLITKYQVPDKNPVTDDELDKVIENSGETLYHPVGTAKMGKDDMSVTDPNGLAVHGMKGLRVIDASIMPFLVSGNTNAPTIAIAENAAKMIMGVKSFVNDEGVSDDPMAAAA
eukprot:Clim_evm4s211 gene=Clim_evmTU4s211